jgi:hypothetical protein
MLQAKERSDLTPKVPVTFELGGISVIELTILFGNHFYAAPYQYYVASMKTIAQYN